ncbi:MAG: uracil-DNA glycosylase family protein [Bauldia sp.]
MRRQPESRPASGRGPAPSATAGAASLDRDLTRLAASIRACRICREAPHGPALPHQPRPVFRVSSSATICIASQAPGIRVHESGTPFTDPSGDRLRAWMGVDSETFYDLARIAIVPMGFCFPGQDGRGADLPPRRECAPAWRTRLFAALPKIELLIAVGGYAQAWHLGDLAGPNLTETVRRWRKIMAATAGPVVLPLPHPSWRNNAWLKANPWFEADLLPVLRAEIARRL